MVLSKYHVELTIESLGEFFTPSSLREIARANVGQDSFSSLFGVEARRHVCDCTISESLAYIDDEHAQIAELAQESGGEARQRAALGRLLHTVQDFYAHTNYVALWMAQKGDSGRKAVHTIDKGQVYKGALELEPQILFHPELQIAQWLTWRDPFYYVPLVGDVMRRFWLPEVSHEAINLDSPKRGSKFHLAMAIARLRTRSEYARAVAAIGEIGGQAAVARFHGTAGCTPSAQPAEA